MLQLQVGTWKWSQILDISKQMITWVICLNSIHFHKMVKLNLSRADHAYKYGGPSIQRKSNGSACKLKCLMLACTWPLPGMQLLDLKVISLLSRCTQSFILFVQSNYANILIPARNTRNFYSFMHQITRLQLILFLFFFSISVKLFKYQYLFKITIE